MGRRKRIEDEELLTIARDLFVEKGIGVSTREIARKAGVSEAVIFQRYSTKADLFFAAMVLPELDVDTLFTGRVGRGNVCEHLEDIALSMMAYFRKLMPILISLLTHPSVDPKYFMERQTDGPAHRLGAGLQEYLDAERDLNRINANDTRAVATLLIATLHSLALFELMGTHIGNMGDEPIRAMVRELWYGLAPENTRTRAG